MADRSAALPLGMPAVAPAVAPPVPGELRRDLRLIAEMIEPGSRVLDIGCGDGALLAYLAREKAVDARGMELSQSGVNACVRHGLSVIQGDADRDLDAFLLHEPELFATLRGFLTGCAEHRGLTRFWD